VTADDDRPGALLHQSTTFHLPVTLLGSMVWCTWPPSCRCTYICVQRSFSLLCRCRVVLLEL
jgi:hypothetical protein